MQYQEYPKMLTHPHATAAVLSTGAVGTHGQAARFQPVTVHTPDDEAYYVAQGYVAPTNGDAAAFERAQMAPSSVSYAEYPKWIADGSEHGATVRSAEEEAAVRAKLGAAPQIAEPVKVRKKPGPKAGTRVRKPAPEAATA